MNEGLAEVFSTCKVRKGKVKWGEPLADSCRLLSEYRSLPVRKMVQIRSEELLSSEYSRSLDVAVAYAQAWACVHYVLFGDTQIPRNALSQYVDAVNRMPPEQAFKTAFGMTCEEMDKRIAQYVHDGEYTTIERKAAKVPAPVIEPASAADVNDALGRLALGGGLVDKAAGYADALVKESDDARGYDLRGRVALKRDDLPAAYAAFQQAVKRNSRDFRSYFQVAAERLEELRQGGAAGSPPQQRVRETADLFERALSLDSGSLHAYSALADLIDDLAVLTADDLRWIRKGLVAFPNDPEVCMGAAKVEQRSGNLAEALRLIERVLANPEANAGARADAARLRERCNKTVEQAVSKATEEAKGPGP